MKIRDRLTGYQPPGDWAHTDDMNGYPPCPECGAAEDAQCSYLDPKKAHFGVEVSGYVHQARVIQTDEDVVALKERLQRE